MHLSTDDGAARDLLIAWTRAFEGEAMAEQHTDEADRIVDARLGDPDGALYLWEDGQPVSMAGQSGLTANGSGSSARACSTRVR